jgi:hypothetical protein
VTGAEGAREAADWSRLILWRPRPEFPLPAEWADRASIPLGELRPLLQAVSPVRDLSDVWRWVAAPIPLADVQAALAAVSAVEVRAMPTGPGGTACQMELRVEGQALRASLVPGAQDSEVERIELTERQATWLTPPTSEARRAMLAVASALRSACRCVAVVL